MPQLNILNVARARVPFFVSFFLVFQRHQLLLSKTEEKTPTLRADSRKEL